MINSFLNFYFQIDELAILMMGLVVYIGLCIISFASRYMKGDHNYHIFFINLIILIFSVTLMVSTDQLALLLVSSYISNMLLADLMAHKSHWEAARVSAGMARKNYTLSAIFMGAAFIIFYLTSGKTSIHAIIQQGAQSIPMWIALVLILLAAMMQSGIWPFHKWLISSANSPTPVSAMMHAGLINGGGFLLVRFAPLYLQNPSLLLLIFLIGLVTAVLGTLWKLMQTDVKRMLACSTMGQMGFMLAQCGLGLFPSAVAHLVWHGMFKAYLFLASSGAAQEKRLDLAYPPQARVFISALICGIAGSLGFAYASGETWLASDTTLVLMLIAFLAATQFALPLLRVKTLKNLSWVIVITTLVGFLYGASVHLIMWIMEPMRVMQPQALNGFYILGMIILTLSWLLILFMRNVAKPANPAPWSLKAYVKTLNASQPHPASITAHRNHYQY